ncbi:MAG TPA: S41 family peptidase [Pyrinomonadaceae bacterium]|nr:S41 family peptidase [Pyrinomonadaceae bacterium]
MKFFSYLAILIFALSAYSQTARVTSESSPVKPGGEFSQARLVAFNKVWNTVNEKHYDATFGGIDWAKVREIYLPKAEAAKSDEAFHSVLRQMLGELKLSHFGIFPPPPAAGNESANGSVGIDIIWLDGLAVINRVDKDSSADAAGLKPGFVVSKIDDKSVLELLKPVHTSFAKRTLTEGVKKVYLERSVEALIAGKSETPVKIEVLQANDAPKTVELIRKPFTGEMSQPVGNFPKQEVVFESRLLPGNIGYIRFNMWIVPQMPKIRAAVREYAKANGIIIDLRGNPGGLGGMAPGLAGLISDKQMSLGSMASRGGVTNLIAYPQSDPYLGKIVVLTDHGSASTSELFAAGMQESGRGKIVGETTAGAVLPSVFEILPTGYTFQYAISDYKTPKSVLIEGKGVSPDMKVLQTRRGLLDGRDAQLEAAINALK